MTKLNWTLNRISDCISGFWCIATTKNKLFEYVIEDIQLQERNNILSSQVYYRAIGSRRVKYDSASELNETDVFSKFSHVQAQAIVTLSTLENIMPLDHDSLVKKYRGYAEKCAKEFRSQRKK